MVSESRLRIVWVYPELLSTYGDRGNVTVVRRRAALGGIATETLRVSAREPVPSSGDLYLLGGGEDRAQTLAARRLRVDGGLARAVDTGAAVFGVCAGYQILGAVFGDQDGRPEPGLDLLDLRSDRGEERAVGEVAGVADGVLRPAMITGFENHRGLTSLGPEVRPLAGTLTGVGNGDGTEGAYRGHVLGTYMHGPALARNPALADLLLAWAAGRPVRPIADDAWVERLREERLASVLG